MAVNPRELNRVIDLLEYYDEPDGDASYKRNFESYRGLIKARITPTSNSAFGANQYSQNGVDVTSHTITIRNIKDISTYSYVVEKYKQEYRWYKIVGTREAEDRKLITLFASQIFRTKTASQVFDNNIIGQEVSL